MSSPKAEETPQTMRLFRLMKVELGPSDGLETVQIALGRENESFEFLRNPAQISSTNYTLNFHQSTLQSVTVSVYFHQSTLQHFPVI
jgi:hypothetical protein